MCSGYPRSICSSSSKTSADRFGTLGGMMAGGRKRPCRSRPGKTSDGDAKKAANPRVKKLGESPGLEKISRGIWKWRSPIWIKHSASKSCDINRGTVAGQLGQLKELSLELTCIELRICEELHELRAILWPDVVACRGSVSVTSVHEGSYTLEMSSD